MQGILAVLNGTSTDFARDAVESVNRLPSFLNTAISSMVQEQHLPTEYTPSTPVLLETSILGMDQAAEADTALVAAEAAKELLLLGS